MSFETLSVDDGLQNLMIIKAHFEPMAQVCLKLNIDKCKMINNYMFGIALNNLPHILGSDYSKLAIPSATSG